MVPGMIDFIQSYFMGVIAHYKKMPTPVFIVAMISLGVGVVIRVLTLYGNWSSRRQRIKLWIDIGYSREDAQARIKKDDELIKRIEKENSLWSLFLKLLKKIWRR